MGEGQYDKADGKKHNNNQGFHLLSYMTLIDNTISLLGVKLYKYCISPIPKETTLPTFLDFFTFDLLDAVKAHATYRFVIQSREDRKVHFLVCLFSFNKKSNTDTMYLLALDV